MSIDHNSQETGQVPHTGKLPEGLRELPIPGAELSATLADRINPDDTVDVPTTTEPLTRRETIKTDKPEKRGGFREFWEKPIGKVAVIGGGVVLAAGSVFVGSKVVEAIAPGTVASAPGVPGEAPVDPIIPEEEPAAPDRYEGADFERAPVPADIEVLDNMSIEEFKAQPKSEQLKWASWAADYFPEFVEYYHSVSGLQVDAPYTLTPDSDILIQIENNSYVQRVATNFGEGTPTSMDFNGPLDKVRIEKFITAHTVADPLSQGRIDKFVDGVGQNGQAINVVAQARSNMFDTHEDAAEASDFSATETLINVDGTNYEAQRVTFTTDEGVLADFTIGVVPYTNYLGQQAFDTIIQ